MRIVMVGQRGVVLGEKGGGIERHVAELAPRLAAMGHDVTVYCRPQRGSGGDDERPEWFQGVRLRYVPTMPLKRFETFFATLVATMRATKERPDVIHFHGIGPGAFAWLTTKLLPKTTTVVTSHGQDQFHGKWGFFARRMLTTAERMAIRYADYCIAVSHVLQVHYRDTFGVEAVYIPNGADIKPAPTPELLRLFKLQQKKYLLAVGRLVPQKGWHELIAAFRDVPTDMQLVIVGAASYTQDYERELQTLAAQDTRVRLVGYQEGAALAALYAHAYCFVHPSHAEGLSVAVLEAMSYGLAPIVADIPANLEVIHGAGFVFPVGNVPALRSALAKYLSSPDEIAAMGIRAKKIVAEQFTWDRCAERTRNVYLSARH